MTQKKHQDTDDVEYHNQKRKAAEKAMYPDSGTGPASGTAEVMARVRSEEPPEEPGLYWTEPKDPATGDRIGPEPAKVYRDGDTLRVPFQTRPDKVVGEVDYLWTGPFPTPEQISERREAP